MNPIHLCLLLPITCVLSIPMHYDARSAQNYELPSEFWTQNFGPDFKHAVHFDLQQTDLIDSGNGIGRHLPVNKEGNKKRSTYIVHKPHASEHSNRSMETSMRVHLLEPHEVEELEKEMVNYARGNPMAQSPVVVNLPASDDSMARQPDRETPVVLKVPPVVYHSTPNMIPPHYMENTNSNWEVPSYENIRQPSYDSMQHSYQRMPTSYEYKGVHSQDGSQLPSFENQHPSQEDIRQITYDDKMLPTYEDKRQPSYEEERDAKDLNKDDETV